MLALDKKLNCIEATASEVLVVYQSVTPVNVAPNNHKTEPCEAYICAINKNDLPYIYVALATKSGKVFVYKPSSQPVDADYEQILQESIDFVKVMGFTMESVDLNYSAAMKTVVVGNIKVIRLPGTAARAVMKKRTDDAALLKGDKLDTSPQPVAAVEGSAPAAVSPISIGKVASGFEDELTELRVELARLVAEKAQGEANEENALAVLSGEVAELVAARDAAILREQELSALQRATAEELIKARAELERVATELSMAAEVATAQSVKSRLADTELRIEQARLATELAAAALREQDLTTAKDVQAEDLAAMRIDVAELAAVQEKELVAVREVLAAELKKMREEVASLSVEGQLPASREDEIFSDGYALPVAESPILDVVTEILEVCSEAENHVDNSEKGPAKETTQRRLEEVSLKWTDEDYFRPPEDETLPGGKIVRAYVPDKFPFFGEEQAFPHSSADEDDSPEASFMLVKGVSAIGYSAAEDILELYTSVNVVQINPEGGKLQSSKAYICSVGKCGVARVFVGLYLMESCRTLVYIQGQPPVAEAVYGRAISKAMEFVEAVGFMMEPVALDFDPVQRCDVLGRLPVLKLEKNIQDEDKKA